jgi:ATP adenylyltransferase/5',5'''-P-1,P-4-tetraphosphate phosphorylase II
MTLLPLLDPDSLRRYTTSVDLSDRTHALLQQQKDTWPLLARNYDNLSLVRTRSFDFDGFQLSIQFNPGRLTSSAAKVDEKSIRERKCFLCVPHLPQEQRGLTFLDSYLILCNPYPIFPEHFTIAHLDHVPQKIEGEVEALLELAAGFGRRYIVFYNGPKSGASAPDHMHFQAGSKGFMHIDEEYPSVIARFGRVVSRKDDVQVFAVVEGYLRRFVAFESGMLQHLTAAVSTFISVLREVAGTIEEPMVNLIASAVDGRWRVLIFPRSRHRPSVFFAEGDKRILLSPAAVDMGGVSITPREEDFHKMTREDLACIHEEVGVERDFLEHVIALWQNHMTGGGS